ncbi:hypothetical protein [Actinophytocola sp. NPDC049390]|uniref:hypothetical protein n=1 Tax=Actinophytocola sp. NPDC049390 TaxID=3363894 RepID=UPI0037B01D66
MARSTDEFYDLLVKLDREVAAFTAEAQVRLTHVEARADRTWHVWLAVLGPLVSLPVALYAATKGAS